MKKLNTRIEMVKKTRPTQAWRLPYFLMSSTALPAILLGLLLFSGSTVFAQTNITEMEYYVDNDPGFGSATSISITASTLVDIPLELISAAALPTGFHTLGIRAKNAGGLWGFVEKRQFYIPTSVSVADPPAYDIIEMEYYVDSDPG